MCVDKTKAIFLQDAIEVLDKNAPEYFEHDLYTPHLIKNNNPEEKKALKYVGNVVIPGKHVKKILLDNRFERIF